MLTILAFTSAAMAAEPRHEITFDLGTLNSNDPAWNILGGQQSPSSGIRAGYGATPWLTVLGSWHLSRIQTDHGSSYYDYEEPHADIGHESSVHESNNASSGQVLSELSIHHLSLGAKFSHEVKRWLVPYATAQGRLHIGNLRVTDKWDAEDASIDLNASGLGYGGSVSAGVELRSKPIGGSMSLAAHLEFGYAMSTDLDFALESEGSNASIGSLNYNGPTVSAGVGLRF